MKFKIWDKVKIIKKSNNHCYHIWNEVYIKEDISHLADNDSYKLYNTSIIKDWDNKIGWCLRDYDIELVEHEFKIWDKVRVIDHWSHSHTIWDIVYITWKWWDPYYQTSNTKWWRYIECGYVDSEEIELCKEDIDSRILNTYVILNDSRPASKDVEWYEDRWANKGFKKIIIEWDYNYTILWVTSEWDIFWSKYNSKESMITSMKHSWKKQISNDVDRISETTSHQSDEVINNETNMTTIQEENKAIKNEEYFSSQIEQLIMSSVDGSLQWFIKALDVTIEDLKSKRYKLSWMVNELNNAYSDKDSDRVKAVLSKHQWIQEFIEVYMESKIKEFDIDTEDKTKFNVEEFFKD